MVSKDSFIKEYFAWIKSQLTGLEPMAWGLYGFGMGINTMSFVSHTITWQAIVAFIAVAFGFLCTITMAAKGWVKFTDKDGTIKEKLVVGRSINGLLGAISVIGYVIINGLAGHWWSVLDQFIFFFAIDLTLMRKWRTWGKGDDENVKVPTVKTWTIAILGLLIGWAILYPIGIHLHDTQPLTDALVLAIGATASVMYVKRYTGTYSLWMASNVVNVILWFLALQAGSDASLPMLLMTALYTMSSIYGRINFRGKNNGRVRNLGEK